MSLLILMVILEFHIAHCLMMWVRLNYGVHLMLVFPIVFFSLRLNLDELLFPYFIPIVYDNRRFFSVTLALMGFIFLGANFVPNIWDAFQFTGATATIVVGFILPSTIAFRFKYFQRAELDTLILYTITK